MEKSLLAFILLLNTLKNRADYKNPNIRTIVSFLQKTDASIKDLERFNKATEENPLLRKKLENLVKHLGEGKRRERTLSHNGILKVKTILYGDRLLEANLETFEVTKCLGKSRDQIAFEIQSIIRNDYSKTIYCTKTPDGLEISGFKKHTPRPELAEF